VKRKIVVLFSGGLDSTVLLAKCLMYYDEVVALNFDYGSKHNKRERAAARAIATKYNVKCFEYTLPSYCQYQQLPDELVMQPFLASNLLITGEEIPEGHYEDKKMEATIVPFRNGIMLSLAIGFAESLKFNVIGLAAQAGDYAVYPDCRPKFFQAMREASLQGTKWGVGICVPFLKDVKKNIVIRGSELKVPFELTWTCYKGGKKHCGKCSACVERIEAFKLANIEDPVEYETA